MRRRVNRAVARLLLPKASPATYAFEHLLGESTDAARALLHDWFFYRQLEARSWDAGGCPATLLDADAVAAYLHASRVGVVLATIHLGDYLEGLRALRGAIPLDRPVFVLRQREFSGREARAFVRAGRGIAPTVLRTDDARAAATAARALRHGAVLVALYDLPRRYGRTVELDFFGHRAHVVRGPADLALLGRADVLPFFTHYAGAASIVEALPVVAACADAQPGVDRGALLMQQLWTAAEAQIRRHPAQWSHWSLLDEWLPTPADGSTGTRR